MKKIWGGNVLTIGLAILATSGCNNKAVHSLELESAQTSSEVEELREEVENLQGLVEEQGNAQDELLEVTESLAGKIEAINESLGVLASADKNTTSQIAELSTKLDRANIAVADLYAFVKEMRNADQRELERLEQRQAKIAEASRPTMLRIAQLTANRDAEMARLIDANSRIETHLKGPGVSPGGSAFWAAEAALNNLEETKKVHQILVQRANAIQQTINQIDAAIQNERANLSDIQSTQ